MASAGTQRLVIARILNHTDSSVTAVYDRHGYDAEKRVALARWANELVSIASKSMPPSPTSQAAAGDSHDAAACSNTVPVAVALACMSGG